MSTTQLPYNIRVTVIEGGGSVSSALRKAGVLHDQHDDAETFAAAQGGANMLESFLLALACEGVDVQTPQFAAALETAVVAFNNHHG